MAQELGIAWKVETSGLTRGMEQATDLVVSSAGGMERAFASAGNVLEGLHGNVKGFTSTLRGEGRMVSFWTRDIAEMTGAGKEAQTMMRELGGVAAALMSGNAIIIGIEAIKAGISVIHSLAKGSKDELTELGDAYDKLIAKKYAAMGGEVDQAYADAIKKPLAEYMKVRADLQSQIATMQRGGAGDTPQAAQARINAIATLTAQLTEATKKYQAFNEAAQAERDAARIDIDRAKRTAGENQGPESVKGSTESLAAFNAIGGHKDGLDYSRAWAEAVREDRKGKDDYFPESTAGKGQMEAAIQADRLAEGLRLLAPLQQSEVKQYEAMGKAEDFYYKHKEELDRKDQLELSRSINKYREYGLAVGQTLAQVMEGHKSMAALVNSVLQQMMKALYEWAVETIKDSAAVAAAKAGASAAAGGPFVAIAAAGVAYEAISALANLLIGSAEGGADLPAFSGSRLLRVHSEEMVLPRSLANTVRSAAGDDGGSAGGGMHFHFNGPVYDKNGVVQAVEDHWQDFQRLVAKKTLDRKGI